MYLGSIMLKNGQNALFMSKIIILLQAFLYGLILAFHSSPMQELV